MKRDKFFIVMSILCLGIVLVGFAPVYFLRSFEIVSWEKVDAFSRHGQTLPIHLHIHGFALTAWYFLFAIQPNLIANNRVAYHKSIGNIGVVIAVSVVATGLYTVFYRDAYLVDRVTARAVGNLFTLFAFAMCFAAAIRFRRLPKVHKRLMLIGSIAMLPPALDRWNIYPGYRNFADSALGWLPGPTQFATPIAVLLSMLAEVVAHDLLKEKSVLTPSVFRIACVLLFGPALASAIVLTGLWQYVIEAFA